jgi:hypothetical protein
VILASTAPVKSGSSSFEARVPGLVVFGFERETGVMTSDQVEGVVGLTGCGGFPSVLRKCTGVPIEI